MNKNTLLAIVLSMLVIMGWPIIAKTFFPEMFPPPDAIEQQEEIVVVPQGGWKDEAATFESPEEQKPAPEFYDKEEKLVIIETAKCRFTLSTKGAGIKRISFMPIDSLDKENIDFIDHEGPGYPLSFQKISGIIGAEDINFSVVDSGQRSVTFEAKLPSDLSIEREYIFYDEYHYDIVNTIQNHGKTAYVFDSGYELLVARKLVEEDKANYPFLFAGFMGWQDNTPEFEKAYGKSIFRSYPKPLRWAFLQNKYFTHIFFSETLFNLTSIKRKKESGECFVTVRREEFTLKPGESITDNYRVYSGPKDYALLKSYENNFEKGLYFGMLGKIRLGLLLILRYLYKITRNYGIAIIGLTILVKVILYPLTHKSFQSMKVQKELAPKITALREKYKNDPQKVQKEMMALYKKEGVNPLGGCLPMLLQLPIFIALFGTLRASFELRHAPFLWIPDLAAKDPTFVLPVVTLGVTFLQQKMTPAGGDPKQQKMMMMFMLVFMSFIIFQFPAGLLLYWLVSSVLSMGQQYYNLKKP